MIFPVVQGERRGTIDLPMDLVDEIVTKRNLKKSPNREVFRICKQARTVFVPEHPYARIAQGLIQWDLISPEQSNAWMQFQRNIGINAPIASRLDPPPPGYDKPRELLNTNWDVTRYQGNDACRLPDDLRVDGILLRDHLRGYVKRQIERIWSVPGFKVELTMLDCEDRAGVDAGICDASVSFEQRNAWEKDDVIWNIYLNAKPFHRPSYKRRVLKLNNMYMGLERRVLAHEAGHQMGLDDEYISTEGSPSSQWRRQQHCDTALAGAPNKYIMCKAEAGSRGIQGVYPWLITRRYAIAEEYQCRRDEDCAASEFCDTGTARLGRNLCVARLDADSPCVRDRQCGAGNTCRFFRCEATGGLGLNQACNANGDCASGNCGAGGVCRCDQNEHCPSGQYCDQGVALGIGANQCRMLRPEGALCSNNRQCADGLRCRRARCRSPQG